MAPAPEALKLDPAPSGLATVLAARTVPAVGWTLLGRVVADRFSRRTSLSAAGMVRGRQGMPILDQLEVLIRDLIVC